VCWSGVERKQETIRLLSNLSLPGSAGPVLDVPLAWSPLELKASNAELFQYCRFIPPLLALHAPTGIVQSSAFRCLATFGEDPTKLRNALIRIALASNTPSATAVVQSMLALASLHRDNVHLQAVELKITALNALISAFKGNIGTIEATQHVAAGMLLCSYEVSIAPDRRAAAL
jgi:hypothetical protein